VRNIALLLFTVSVFIFSVSYAFSQYVRFREHNLNEINTWLDCVKTVQLSDQAYEFCRTKVSENYLFEVPYDWKKNLPARGAVDDEW
jgi:hypothetical protein